jgi:tryptophanyl-tRNA synthetase
MSTLIFDNDYYARIMQAFGYSPLEFEPIAFALGNLDMDALRQQWLCHTGVTDIISEHEKGKSVVATTGFGLSGVPHVGTLMQILKAIRLQRAGIDTQIVLGDLDAYNGKTIPLEETQRLVPQYRRFVEALGFNSSPPHSLRTQYESLSTLRLMYILGRFMDQEMFDCAEEDLHTFYKERGKVDPRMTYRRQLSLNLMIADFLELLTTEQYDAVIVFLGIDEHRYVDFGRQTLNKATTEFPDLFSRKQYGALYSGIIAGLNGYPKMSKSFPESGITVDMSQSDIEDRIMNGETMTALPDTNVIFQMISMASMYPQEQIKEAREECVKQSQQWKKIKRAYARHLHTLCRHWHGN